MLDATAMVRAVLRWYRVHARDLPWRRTTDPYAIWVSEVMLQQTQVKTAAPYYRRWMARFPDVAALARATPYAVLKHWAGLGYYSRARNLHAAARRVVSEFGGLFPRDFATVSSLPGIGRYTAGAICSIAFNQPTPALDGNVARVLARVLAIRGRLDNPRIRDRLWSAAAKLVKAASRLRAPRACGDLNQGLMELGATVCAPRRMECPRCPLRRNCAARRLGIEIDIPAPRTRPRAVNVRRLALACVRHDRVCVCRRVRGEHNAGLWEFPFMELGAAAEARGALVSWCGIASEDLRPLVRLKHAITHRRIALEAYWARVDRAPRGLGGVWQPLERLPGLAFSSAHRRIAEALSAREAKP